MSKNIPDLIAQMTLEGKAALCTGEGPWNTIGMDIVLGFQEQLLPTSAKEMVGGLLEQVR